MKMEKSPGVEGITEEMLETIKELHAAIMSHPPLQKPGIGAMTLRNENKGY